MSISAGALGGATSIWRRALALLPESGATANRIWLTQVSPQANVTVGPFILIDHGATFQFNPIGNFAVAFALTIGSGWDSMAQHRIYSVKS
jgi:hypothetical protein